MARATVRCDPDTDARGGPDIRARRLALAAALIGLLAGGALVTLWALGGEGSPCTLEVASLDRASTELGRRPGGDVICLRAGRYGRATLTAQRATYATLRAVPDATVVLEDLDIAPGARHLRVEGLTVSQQVNVGQGEANDIRDVQLVSNRLTGIEVYAGASDVLIAHNRLAGCGTCIGLISSDPRVPGAPTRDSAILPPVSRVTIRGNLIEGAKTDALFLTNFRDVVVEDNEITGIVEAGEHSDCLQTVWGGRGLVYRGNYVHDNRCQGLFIKDGLVSDVVLEDNLLVRNDEPSRAPGQPSILTTYNVQGLRAERNTIWTGDNVGPQYDPAMGPRPKDHLLRRNVIGRFVPYDVTAGSDKAGVFRDPAVMSEDENVIGDGWTWLPAHLGPHSVQQPQPAFRDPARGDYRLEAAVSAGGRTFDAGVTWRPQDRRFGP